MKSELITRIQLKNDTEANWLTVADSFVPLVGEACVTNDGENKGKFKIGDGTSTWGQLPYVGGAGGGSIELPVDASQVDFSQDLVFTEPFGKYEPVNGKVTVPVNGKTLLEVLLDAYAEDVNPTITQPSVSISSTQAGAYEVGNKVTPAYSLTFNPGKYEFGPDTGVTATDYTVKAGEETVKGQTGSLKEVEVIDNINYSFQGEVTYTEGAIPLTALGQEYEEGKIQAGTKASSTLKITGYRNGFYGTQDSITELDSTNIRALSGKSNKAVTTGAVWNISLPVGAKRVIFAYPATLADVSSVQDVNGLNAEIKSSFTKQTVSVTGANDYNGIDYKVYYLDYANPNDTQNTYKVTI